MVIAVSVVGVIGVIVIILLFILILLNCQRRKPSYSLHPNQTACKLLTLVLWLLTMHHMHTARNPAYGMSAPNDAVNVKSEHSYDYVNPGKLHDIHCLSLAYISLHSVHV